ncbi:MAG: response regulator [Deltaproteobacteria bacterium]|jgi:DNA-binding response OmpR family regulator|nr:response regulator [Deltaproteobacteria bacterium]
MARILVIDDDDLVLEMLYESLTREGYDVLQASNGEQGLRLYREEPVDLIITDLIMPEKEGIETIIELRKDFPDVKIIAISGGGYIGTKDHLRMAKILGVQRTFTKPVARKQLLDAVRELVKE